MSQGILNFGSGSRAATCKLCGMSYQSSSEPDRNSHSKFHSNFVNGPLFGLVHDRPVKAKRLLSEKRYVDCKVHQIPKGQPKLIKRTEELLKLVNQELNAPPGNNSWKESTNGSLQGMAYVAIINKRAVALCITEPITDHKTQARWMVYSTQQVVPNQVNENARIGISRIWVAPKWRRKGLGLMMLEAILSASVYGMALKKSEIAFSQPSSSGALLAKKFNGVLHKSGQVLLPIYLES